VLCALVAWLICQWSVKLSVKECSLSSVYYHVFAEGGRLDKGPLAVWLRLQDAFAAQLGRSFPMEVMATGKGEGVV
jgi:hypothetical protein